MSRTNLQRGRVNQKFRTRKALLEAANRLVNQGQQPSLEEIAEEAMVSRATAYRYFPSMERLLIEAHLHRETLFPQDLLSGRDQATPSERAALVHDHMHDLVANNEASFRTLLRACMDDWISSKGRIDEYLRGGRRLPMIDEAIKDLKPVLTRAKYRRLRLALAAMVGIEPFVVLRDVCGLKSEEAKKVLNWAVRTLVDAVE